MAEEEIEEIRKKRLNEQKKLAEAAKAEEQLRAALRIALDETAYDRLMNISYANKEFYLMVAQRILAIFREVKRKINEDELLYIISSLKNMTEKQTGIRFHRK